MKTAGLIHDVEVSDEPIWKTTYAPLTWTKSQPTVEDFYWHRMDDEPNSEMIVEFVPRSNVSDTPQIYYTGDEEPGIPSPHDEWAGPIPKPVNASKE